MTAPNAMEIPGQPSWRSHVEGYVGAESFAPGEVVTVHCSSVPSAFSATVTRVGAERVVVWERSGIAGVFRDVGDAAYADGCDWPSTFEFTVGSDWASGYYEVRFSWEGSDRLPDGGTYACFVVRSPNPDPARPLLVLATSTWQAYNEWGGSGLYRGATQVSLDRPYDRGFLVKRADIPPVRVADVTELGDFRQQGLKDYLQRSGYGLRAANAGWFNWERPFVAWAERNGYPLDLATSSDLQFHPDVLDGRRLMLSVGHDEYWSAAMRDAVEGFAAGGGNVAFFSGDICTGKIRYAPGGRSWTSHVMAGRVDADPEWPDGDATGFWIDPALERPETRLTGVSTAFAGYARFGRSTPRGARGFLVQQPDHWVFEGTDARWGDVVGADGCLAGFELSGCPVELRANRLVAAGRHGTPSDAEVIAAAPAHLWRNAESSELFAEEDEWADSVLLVARLLHGDNPTAEQIETLSNGWATMLVHQPGGTVFTAGSTEWALCLDDAVVKQMTTNILNRLLGRRGA